ncbi:MAG: hypothetical protein ACFFCS_21210 [Candidatus Hodarchaeota archaeon]
MLKDEEDRKLKEMFKDIDKNPLYRLEDFENIEFSHNPLENLEIIYEHVLSLSSLKDQLGIGFDIINNRVYMFLEFLRQVIPAEQERHVRGLLDIIDGKERVDKFIGLFQSPFTQDHIDATIVSILEKYPITDSWKYSIEGPRIRGGRIQYSINPSGIYLNKIWDEKYDNSGTPYIPEPTIDRVWQWDDFKITTVLIKKDKSDREERYNFTWNGDEYRDFTLKEMRDRMFDKCCLGHKYKIIFGVLISKYVKEHDIPRKEYSPLCGFSRDGWRLPGKFWIKFTQGIQQSQRENIEEMMSINVDSQQARKYMKILYNSIYIEHKDIFFARSMVMPFLYSLRERTSLIPWLSTGSSFGGTGKSSMLKTMTTKIWNVPDKVLNKEVLDSESRAGDYFSLSTFGTVIDDAGDMNPKIKNIIKTYVTQESRFQRKTIEHKLAIDKVFCSPLNFTFNTPPELFDDIAFLERGIHVPLTIIMTKENDEKFKRIKEIPNGYLGKYLYEQTKDWDYESLVKLYENMPSIDGIRANVIYKTLYLGNWIMKEFFGISLNLNDVPNLIAETLSVGSDDIISLFLSQIDEGVKAEREYWVKGKISQKYNKDGTLKGFFYTINNLQDLISRLNLKNITMSGFCEILKKKYKGLEYKNYWIPDLKKTVKCIYIPSDILEETDFQEERGFDVDRIQLGRPKSKFEKSKRLLKIIETLQDENANEPVFLNDIIQAAILDDINEDEVQSLVELLKEDSNLIEVKNKQYMIIR